LRSSGIFSEGVYHHGGRAAGSYDIIGNSPEEFRKFLDAELKRYAEIARVAKVE
jgi:hypothetical protein